MVIVFFTTPKLLPTLQLVTNQSLPHLLVVYIEVKVEQGHVREDLVTSGHLARVLPAVQLAKATVLLVPESLQVSLPLLSLVILPCLEYSHPSLQIKHQQNKYLEKLWKSVVLVHIHTNPISALALMLRSCNINFIVQ